MASPSNHATAFGLKCHFFNLPVEVRLDIYEYNFATSTSIYEPTDQEISCATALLCTCKHILDEAGDIFQHYETELHDLIDRRACQKKAALSWSGARLTSLGELNEEMDIHAWESAEYENIDGLLRLMYERRLRGQQR